MFANFLLIYMFKIINRNKNNRINWKKGIFLQYIFLDDIGRFRNEGFVFLYRYFFVLILVGYLYVF